MPKAAKYSPSATNSAQRKIVKRNPHCFPTSRRILRRADFQSIYNERVRSGCSLFSAFIRDTGSSPPARIGITVTRKAVGNAVARNRAKRLFREAARKHWDLLPDGLEIVLLARRPIVGLGAAEVEAEFVRLLPHAIRRASRD